MYRCFADTQLGALGLEMDGMAWGPGGDGAGDRKGVLRWPLGRPEEARSGAVGSLAPFSACLGVGRAEAGFGGRPAWLTETVWGHPDEGCPQAP